MEGTSVSNEELETIIIKHSNPEDNHGDFRQKMYRTEQLCSTAKSINMLALQTMIMKILMPHKRNINANGTWQSISKWGKSEGLNREQQTAFEIVAAMYVLSFNDEAMAEAINAENYEKIVKKKKGL
jgi:hypothetical protein